MFRIVLLLLALAFSAAPAAAQNTTCANRPSTDSSNACANTSFVQGLSSWHGAWVTYTPTISCGSGTMTSATATGRYKILTAKTYAVEINVAITTNGTCGIYVGATLPNGITSTANFSFVGREILVSGKTLAGVITTGSNMLAFVNYDNSYPGANGYNLAISGILEVN